MCWWNCEYCDVWWFQYCAHRSRYNPLNETNHYKIYICSMGTMCAIFITTHLRHKQTKTTKKTEIWNFHKKNCCSCWLSRVNPLCAKTSTKGAMSATKKIPANKFAWILSVCWLGGGRWMMQLMLMLIECWKRRHLSAPHDPKLTHQSPNKWYTTIPIHRHIQLNR